MADTQFEEFERSVSKQVAAWKSFAEQSHRRWQEYAANMEGTKRKGAAETMPPSDEEARQEMMKIQSDTNAKLAEFGRELLAAVGRMELAADDLRAAPRHIADAVRIAFAPLAKEVTVTANVEVDTASRRVKRIRLTPRWKS